MRPEVSARRLLRLADFLKTVPPKRFNYETWVGHGWKGAKDLSCGTTACALGWAAAMPFFRRLGLHLHRGLYGPIPALGAAARPRKFSLEAAMEVFGLTEAEVSFLFFPGMGWRGMVSPGGRATPREVAKHIRSFAKRRARGQA